MKRASGPNLTHQRAVRQRSGTERGKVPATLTTIDIENSYNTTSSTTKRAVIRDGPSEVGIIRSKSVPHFAPHDSTKDRGINMFTPALSRYIKGVEYASMTSLLQDFRRQLERGSGEPIHELTEVNAAELISDLCVFLGLSDQNRRKVLGARAATHIDRALTARARVMLEH
jgi:hypothetical protein